MLTMLCVDYDPGRSGYSDAGENYYPDLEDLSEVSAERKLKENLADIAQKQQGFILLKR